MRRRPSAVWLARADPGAVSQALSQQIKDYMAAGMDDHVAKAIKIAQQYRALSEIQPEQMAA